METQTKFTNEENAKRVKNILQNLGVTRTYKGYYFILDAIDLTLEDETRLLRMVDEIYEPIAAKNKCNRATVERNIRTVILRVWTTHRTALFKIFNAQLPTFPTVSEFIDALTFYILNDLDK